MNRTIISIIIVFISYFSSYKNIEKKADKNMKFVSNDTSYYPKVKNILTSNNKAVYLIYDTIPKYNEFGSIEVIDLKTKEKVRLVDNNYFNAYPLWLSDGKGIIFASARIGDPYRLKITENSAGKQMYYFDFQENKTNDFFKNTEQLDAYDINDFVGLSLNTATKDIYFSNKDNIIYDIDLTKDSLKVLKQLEKGMLIIDLKLSNDNNYLTIEYYKISDFSQGVYIIELKNNEFVYHFEKKGYVHFYGWSIANLPYLGIGDENVEVNFKDNTTKELKFRYDRSKYFLQQIFSESKNTIIVLLSLKKPNFGIFPAEEIARYNFETEELEWLTNDGHKKSNLNVYLKK